MLAIWKLSLGKGKDKTMLQKIISSSNLGNSLGLETGLRGDAGKESIIKIMK